MLVSDPLHQFDGGNLDVVLRDRFSGIVGNQSLWGYRIENNAGGFLSQVDDIYCVPDRP